MVIGRRAGGEPICRAFRLSAAPVRASGSRPGLKPHADRRLLSRPFARLGACSELRPRGNGIADNGTANWVCGGFGPEERQTRVPARSFNPFPVHP